MSKIIFKPVLYFIGIILYISYYLAPDKLSEILLYPVVLLCALVFFSFLYDLIPGKPTTITTFMRTNKTPYDFSFHVTSKPRSPGNFLIIGPTGCGKTLLAKKLFKGLADNTDIPKFLAGWAGDIQDFNEESETIFGRDTDALISPEEISLPNCMELQGKEPDFNNLNNLYSEILKEAKQTGKRFALYLSGIPWRSEPGKFENLILQMYKTAHTNGGIVGMEIQQPEFMATSPELKIAIQHIQTFIIFPNPLLTRKDYEVLDLEEDQLDFLLAERSQSHKQQVLIIKKDGVGDFNESAIVYV